jgi:hypothetical protein
MAQDRNKPGNIMVVPDVQTSPDHRHPCCSVSCFVGVEADRARELNTSTGNGGSGGDSEDLGAGRRRRREGRQRQRLDGSKPGQDHAKGQTECDQAESSRITWHKKSKGNLPARVLARPRPEDQRRRVSIREDAPGLGYAVRKAGWGGRAMCLEEHGDDRRGQRNGPKGGALKRREKNELFSTERTRRRAREQADAKHKAVPRSLDSLSRSRSRWLLLRSVADNHGGEKSESEGSSDTG